MLAHRHGEPIKTRPRYVVLACGAVNTALTLLRSGNPDTGGLANSSGLVGRNYMQHLNTAVMAIGPRRQRLDIFQKTVALTDVYRKGPHHPPLGSAQLMGKLQPDMLAGARPHVPRVLLRLAAEHSVDWFATTEDLPARNRVGLTAEGTPQVDYRPVNLAAHRKLIRFMRTTMRRAGFPIVMTQAMTLADNSHQCGTTRMGIDPAHSVVDPWERCHDVIGLVVADSSVFVSSAAVNPP